MYRFGLRAVETTMLLREDLDLSRQRMGIRRAKHGDAKGYPRPRDFVPVLRRCLRKRPDLRPYLFTCRESTNQRELTVLRVQQLYARAAGLSPGAASHALRHSIGVHPLKVGFALEYVAALFGHPSIRSTAIYARFMTPAREEMIRRLDVPQHRP